MKHHLYVPFPPINSSLPFLLSLLHAQRAVALDQLPKPPQLYFHSALVKRAEEDMWFRASAVGTQAPASR